MKSRRLLITGASGFLGWNLCRAATSRYSVCGTYYSHRCDNSDITPFVCDLRQPSAIVTLFRESAPDAVIHVAAAADPNYCQTHEAEAAAVNISASVEIARHCSLRDIPCVFTSSDLVFDGKNPPYRESDAVAPVNKYGEQKAAAEREIAAICRHAIICRMPLMYGDAPPHAKSFIHPFITSLRNGEVLRLFTDEFRTPLSARNAATGLLLALEHAEAGVFHLGGPQRLSRYTMGMHIASALGINATILPCLQRDVIMTAPRAADVSLDSSKARAFGFDPARMEDEIPHLSCIRHAT